MDSILEVLQSTDKLLEQAQQNLEKLKATKIKAAEFESLQRLLKKYLEVGEALEERREQVFGLLARLALAINARTYSFSSEHVVHSATEVEVRGYALLQGQTERYGISTFSRRSEFYPLCHEMLIRIKNFLGEAPQRHQCEISKLVALLDKVTDLTKIKEELKA